MSNNLDNASGIAIGTLVTTGVSAILLIVQALVSRSKAQTKKDDDYVEGNQASRRRLKVLEEAQAAQDTRYNLLANAFQNILTELERERAARREADALIEVLRNQVSDLESRIKHYETTPPV